MAESKTGQRGFTLLEVVVALGILVLGLTGLFRSFDIGLRTIGTVEGARAAGEAAMAFMSELGRLTRLTDGVFEGDFRGGQHWRLRVEPVREKDPDGPRRALVGHSIRLSVSWTERRQTQTLLYETIRLGPDE